MTGKHWGTLPWGGVELMDTREIARIVATNTARIDPPIWLRSEPYTQLVHGRATVTIIDVCTMEVHWRVERSLFVMSRHQCLSLDATHCCSRAHLTQVLADWQRWQARNLGRLGWSNGSLLGIARKAVCCHNGYRSSDKY